MSWKSNYWSILLLHDFVLIYMYVRGLITVRLKCVDAVVKNEVTLKMRGMYGCSENNGIKVHKEYTPLVIACM